jgi:excisionase family DNA binding protein
MAMVSGPGLSSVSYCRIYRIYNIYYFTWGGHGMEDQLLSIGEAARRLHVSQSTVRGWSKKGILPVIKLPSGHRRFRIADVDRLRADMGLDPIKPESEGTTK